MRKKDDELKGDYAEVHSVVSTALRSLYVFTSIRHEDAHEVRFKHRGGGDWLVVVKRTSPEGKPEVLFSQAYDFVGALVACDRGLDAGRWKEDKPYEPNDK